MTREEPGPRRRHSGVEDRARQPAALSDALQRWMNDRGWHGRLRDSQIHQRWTEIAGADVAAHTEPVRLHGGVLVVRAESGAWATQLRYLAPQLLDRAQSAMGTDRVRRVQIISGETARQGDGDGGPL